MRLAAAALCTLLVWPGLLLPVIAAAQGLEPEDASALAGFPQAPLDRGIVVSQRMMLQGVPRPGNQWRTSTCVGWAVAYAAGSYFHRARLNGPSAALSPAFAYALGNGDARCLAGSRISRVLDALRDVGALPISEYAYDPGWCGRVPTDAERRRAAAFRIPGWAVVPALNPAAAKAQLAAGRVVIFSMGVGPAFDAHRGKEVFDTLETAADVYGHAMVAVGFDDAMQAFRIQNSAGTGWGDDGQAWLSYRVWRERAATAYVITDAPVPAAALAPAPPAASATAVVPAQPSSTAADAAVAQARTAALERLMVAFPAHLAPKRATTEESLRKYLAEKTHRAFALSLPDGQTYRTFDWPAPEMARQMVLEGCQMLYGLPCVLFAEDDEARAPPGGRDWEPQDMPRVRYAGPYDPAQVPGLPSTVRRSTAVAGYRQAPAPKAMALHPWGRPFAVSAAPNQRESEIEALARCNAEPSRGGRDGPCYLYAVGDRVVLPQRRVEPVTP